MANSRDLYYDEAKAANLFYAHAFEATGTELEHDIVYARSLLNAKALPKEWDDKLRHQLLLWELMK